MNADPKDTRPEGGSDKDRLLDHNYDGIQEYDNPLPGWWVWIFWVTIAFSVLYVLNIPGVGTGKGRIANYEEDMRAAQARAEELAARAPRLEVTDASLAALSHDTAALADGRTVFNTQCVPCHRADGGGSIGPNLTDDYWVHGGRPVDLYKTIHDGVLDKGMPAWSQVLKPDQVTRVTAYVISLHGTNPANPKPAQGDRFTADSAAAGGVAPGSP